MQPTLFLSHGSPMLALQDIPARQFFSDLGPALHRPTASVVVSAHWETEVPAINAVDRNTTIHDFHGFPPPRYARSYPAPGQPERARQIAALLGEAGPEAVEQARRAAGVTSNNAEASLQRLLLEPARGNTRRLEAALTVDAALRRIAGRVSALQVDAALHPHNRLIWQAWHGWIGAASALLAKGSTDLPPRPPVPTSDLDGESLARIARQLELSAGALARLDQPAAAS